MKSGSMPRSRRASAVAGPMAATLHWPMARLSRPQAARRFQKWRTPLTEVKMIQPYSARRATAASSSL